MAGTGPTRPTSSCVPRRTHASTSWWSRRWSPRSRSTCDDARGARRGARRAHRSRRTWRPRSPRACATSRPRRVDLALALHPTPAVGRHTPVDRARRDLAARADAHAISTPDRAGGSTRGETASSSSRCVARRSTALGRGCTPVPASSPVHAPTRSGPRPRPSSSRCSARSFAFDVCPCSPMSGARPPCTCRRRRRARRRRDRSGDVACARSTRASPKAHRVEHLHDRAGGDAPPERPAPRLAEREDLHRRCRASSRDRRPTAPSPRSSSRVWRATSSSAAIGLRRCNSVAANTDTSYSPRSPGRA